MRKAERELLAKLFAAEVDAAMSQRPSPVVQCDNATIRWLDEHGYAQRITDRLPGRPVVTITGYVLTHLGRMTYGEMCKDAEGE